MESEKTDSGIDSASASESQNQIQDPSSHCESVKVTNYGVELNQLGIDPSYKEPNDDMEMELVPVCKQHVTNELELNLDISHQTVPIGLLIDFLKFTDSPAVMEMPRSRNQPTTLPQESLNAVVSIQLNFNESLDEDVWNIIFPIPEEPASTHQVSSNQNVPQQNVATGAVNADCIDIEETLYRPVFVNVASTSAAEEEECECIDDRVPILAGQQHVSRSSSDDTPLSTDLNGPQNIGIRKSILMKRVSRRICVTIAGSIFSLSVLVLVVFLAVYILKGGLLKQSSDTIIGTTTFAPILTSMAPRSNTLKTLSVTAYLASITMSYDHRTLSTEKGKNNDSDNRMNTRLLLNNSILLSTISVEGSIRGITVLGSEICIVIGGSTKVLVYNTNNFTLTRYISITGSLGIRAIVASPRYNCLYISDVVLNVVYRYNLSNNDIISWPVGEESFGLSLTRTDNVLVSLYDTKQIMEYTPDGTLSRKISIDNSLEYLYHSVQLSSYRFAVSHGTYSISLNRVCMVDTIGQIIHCYGGDRGSGVGQLDGPRNLAVDRHGNVLVADWGNNRVVLLSPSLILLGYVFIPGQKLSEPWALHLDEPNHRLYIAEYTNTGRVFVLTV